MPNTIKTVAARRIRSLNPGELLETKFPIILHAERLTLPDGKPAPSHLDTKVQCFWNDDALAVLFESRYRTLRVPEKPRAGERYPLLWEAGDVVECFIGHDVRSSGKYKEFQTAPDGSWLDIAVRQKRGATTRDLEWKSGMRCAAQVIDRTKTWNTVMVLPWNALGANPSDTDDWRINFYRSGGDSSAPELLAWSPTGTGAECFHRPEKFGGLTFVLK